MRANLERRARQKRSLGNLIGALFLAAAGALVALLLFQNTPELQAWYGEYQFQLLQLEVKVLEVSSASVWLLIAAVLLLYAIKSVFSLYPISFLCLLTAAVRMPVALSFAVNILGIVILVSLRYFWGWHRGGGGLQKLLSLNQDIRTFLEKEGEGDKAKPWLLFFFRLVPSFPVNPVSQIYGGMGFDYVDYTLISLLGFLPKLISFIIIGNNWQNPLSNEFLVPLIIVFTLSGLSAIGINMALAKQKDD